MSRATLGLQRSSGASWRPTIYPKMAAVREGGAKREREEEEYWDGRAGPTEGLPDVAGAGETAGRRWSVDEIGQVPGSPAATSSYLMEEVLASDTDLMEEVLASETDLVEEVLASETDLMEEVLASETDLVKEVLASDTDLMEEVLACDTDLMEEFLTSESDLV